MHTTRLRSERRREHNGPDVAAIAGRQGFISLLEIDLAWGRRSNSCDSLVRGVQRSQVAGGGLGLQVSE